MRLIEFLGIPEMEEQLAKNGPGGARKGAGRKPIGDVPMVTTAFAIRPDQDEWLSQYPNRSEVVRAALDREIKRKR